MEHIVRIIEDGRVTEKTVVEGTNLLELLRRNPVSIDSPCGGKGTCGKCKIRIGGLGLEPTENEIKLLGKQVIEKGYRLACQTFVNSNIDVYTDIISEDANIVTVGREKKIKINPLISKIYVELNAPDINDQRSDVERLVSCLDGLEPDMSLKMIKDISKILRENDFKVTLLLEENKIKAIEAGNSSEQLYGIAVDIGTTTIATYLYNLITGERTGVYSRLNPQRKYGADVLSRIEYASSCKEASREISQLIVDCINQGIETLLEKQFIEKDQVYLISFAGNTAMMHLLMDIPAKNISVAPFIPATTMLHKLAAKEIGININSYGVAVILPAVSGYIGGDIVAGILSTDMHTREAISLFIDIGTNGEMVLGNREFLYSCSTAAGPAFEGANIRNGLGGVQGAIDKVYFGDVIEYTTIGNIKPKGICGSGVIDAIGEMLKKGLIDETGRIIDTEEANDLSEYYRERLIEVEGMRALLLTSNKDNLKQYDIIITQKDIREIQNAKAAIAAGIISLIKHSNIQMNDIEKVYLAGGFGNYINTDSAVTIGLIPSELKGKIESVGNSAGSGAVECLLSKESLFDTVKIKQRIKYIELSASPEFADQYVDNMFFIQPRI
jgi:uncharacterized 2Fe-2S/4Fe-4S cluster protein (DUF4445 family)